MHAAKPSRDAEFRSLIEAGRLREAAALLPANENELRNEIAVWQSGLAELETQRRREAVTGARYNTARRRLLYRLLDIAKAREVDAAAPAPAAAPTAREKVFISYNHADTAQSIKRVLQERGIHVHIDAAEMQPSEDIRAFITRSIRATSCTFCLISQRSLLSGWMGLESMLALTARELWSVRLFVAGYLGTPTSSISGSGSKRPGASTNASPRSTSSCASTWRASSTPST